MKKRVLVLSFALIVFCFSCSKKEISDQSQQSGALLVNNNTSNALSAGVNQYLGVTCGFQYSAQLTGPPSKPNQQNISLYNPDASNPNATWDEWVAQLAQA